MRETMVSATTKIDELLTKRNQIHTRTASISADVVLTRINEGNLTEQSMINDLSSMLCQFTKEERIEILKHIIVDVALNVSPSNRNNSKPSKKDSGRREVFGRDSFFR